MSQKFFRKHGRSLNQRNDASISSGLQAQTIGACPECGDKDSEKTSMSRKGIVTCGNCGKMTPVAGWSFDGKTLNVMFNEAGDDVIGDDCSFNNLQEQIRNVIKDVGVLKTEGVNSFYPYVCDVIVPALTSGKAVVNGPNGSLYVLSFNVEDGKIVQDGEPKKIERISDYKYLNMLGLKIKNVIDDKSDSSMEADDKSKTAKEKSETANESGDAQDHLSAWKAHGIAEASHIEALHSDDRSKSAFYHKTLADDHCCNGAQHFLKSKVQ